MRGTSLEKRGVNQGFYCGHIKYERPSRLHRVCRIGKSDRITRRFDTEKEEIGDSKMISIETIQNEVLSEVD